MNKEDKIKKEQKEKKKLAGLLAKTRQERYQQNSWFDHGIKDT